MLCLAGQNLSRKMDGEACPAGSCGTVSAMLGAWSDRPRNVTASASVVLPTFLSVVLLCFAMSADRTVMAASRRQGCLVQYLCLLQLDIVNRIDVAASKAATVICEQVFSILALVIFLLKDPFKKCFKIVFFPLWRRDPVLELQFLMPLRVVLLCSACNSASSDRMANAIVFCSWAS